MSNYIKPDIVFIEASTACQLKCVSCERAEIENSLGIGFLKFQDFKKIVDDNPWIRGIDLSNYGEIFLNPDLLGIIKYADKKKIILMADSGVNLNTVSEEVLEALVKYRFYSITVSIDGASQEIYSIYRRNGNFNKVIEHIKKINYYKNKYRAELPLLRWQFIAFGHNTHEIVAAKQMAKDLKMHFFIKLNYDNNFSPVIDKDLVRKESSLGVADIKEYSEKTGKIYLDGICIQLWVTPQINFDGRLLGCCINYWGDFGNAFQEGLVECLNNEKINYARQMLRGFKKSRADIPCSSCFKYKSRRERAVWIKPKEIKVEKIRNQIRLLSNLMKNKIVEKTKK